jgi:molybdopterin-guanine dinucleotide biosynthesis protein
VIVVVGGQSRNVGKTSAVCEILRATKERAWIAMKISPHAHGVDLSAPVLVESTAPDQTDSGRFFEAGAARSFWIRSGMDQFDEALKSVPVGNWIIESNSVVNRITPDVIVFMTDASIEDSKPSGRALAESPLRMTVEEAIQWIRRQAP